MEDSSELGGGSNPPALIKIADVPSRCAALLKENTNHSQLKKDVMKIRCIAVIAPAILTQAPWRVRGHKRCNSVIRADTTNTTFSKSEIPKPVLGLIDELFDVQELILQVFSHFLMNTLPEPIVFLKNTVTMAEIVIPERVGRYG